MDVLSGIDLLTNVKSLNVSSPSDRYSPISSQNIHVHVSDPPTNTNSFTNALVMHRPTNAANDSAESIDGIIDMTMPDSSESSGEYASSEDISPTRSSRPPPHRSGGGGGGRGYQRSMTTSSGSGSGDDDDEEEYEESDVSVVHQPHQNRQHIQQQPAYSREEMESHKRQLLYRLDRLEKKGVHLHRRFSMNDNIEDIQAEYDRLKLNRDIDGSVRMQRRMLIAVVTGIEYLNNKFDPFDVKLNGWSDSINENIDDYDDVFEELFLKYRGKAKMAPELNLMMMVGGSGLMFHITNSMFKSSNLPDLADVMKRNPDLMRQFTQATMETMNHNGQYAAAPPPPPPIRSNGGGGGGGGGGALGGIMNMFFGGGKGQGKGGPVRGPPPPSQQQYAYESSSSMSQPGITVVNNSQQQHMGMHGGSGGMHGGSGGMMRGPKNVDDILKELKRDAALPPPTISQHESPALSRMSSGSLPSLGELIQSNVPSVASATPATSTSKKAAAPRKRNAAKARSTLDI